MSDKTNLIAFPTTPSSSKEPTDEQLMPYAERLLQRKKGENPETKLTVEIVLRSKVIRAGLAKEWQADLDREREAEEAALAAELAVLEEEFNPPPAVIAKPVIIKPKQPQAPEIPLQVERCRDRMVAMFPGCVFEHWEAAAALRFHLVKFIKFLKGLLDQSAGENATYVQLLDRRFVSTQEAISLINQVLEAWTRNPKTAVADYFMIRHLGDLLKEPEFCFLLDLPTRNQALEMEAAEIAAQKRKECRKTVEPLLKELLEKVGANPGSIDKMADRLIRKYLNVGDAQAILCEAAIDKMLEAKDGDDEFIAKLYAKAAGLNEEELAQVVADKKLAINQPVVSSKANQAEQLRKKQARSDADNNLRPKPNQGAGDITRLGYANPSGGKSNK